MSFSPLTRLVYLPVQETGFLYKSDEHFQKKAISYNVGIDFVAGGMPQQPEVKKAILGYVDSTLQASDVQSLAQAAADRLDAGLGP